MDNKVSKNVSVSSGVRQGCVSHCAMLCLRKEPNEKSEVLRFLPAGTAVEISGKVENGWYPVTTSDKDCGFCKAEFITDK